MNADRRRELEDLLRGGETRVENFFRLAPDPKGDLEDIIDEARFEAASRLSPGLGSLRNSTYIVRVRSDDGQDENIDGASLRAVMAGIEEEVLSAADSGRNEARLALDDVTQGSIVLHYRAINPLSDVNEGEFDHGLSVVGAAIERVSRLHHALEEGRQYSEIAQIASSTDLLKASRGLLQSLTKHGLNLTTRWRSAAGDPVLSSLSFGAKATAANVFEKAPVSVPLHIFGRVTSLDISGWIKVQASAGRHRAYEIKAQPDVVVSGILVLGEVVHLTIRQETAEDLVGLKSEPKYFLESINPPMSY
jgi:hypothetical protein